VFQDDPSFANGRGREVVTDDVFYSLRRFCDSHWTPTGYWLINGRIEGLDAYRKAESDRKAQYVAEGRTDEFQFDYERPISGFVKLDDHHFQIRLNMHWPQFLYVMAMSYTAVVPREAVEFYDLEFGQHPVGTGPFRLEEFWRGSWLKLERNPTFRDERVPDDLHPQQIALGLGDYVGRRLPLVDRIVMELFEQDQPMWLKFRTGDVDVVQVPAEYWPIIYEKDWTLKPWAQGEGIRYHNLPLLDLIYWGFNMHDPLWGSAKMKPVRKAVAYAVNIEERNDVFYNGTNTLYRGPIPPGLEGYEPGHRKQDIERARALMAEAGYPDGKGLPTLVYESSRGGNAREQTELFRRQMKKIGIQIDVNFNSFPELSEKMNQKKAQFFGLAWGADYPDSENFLQMFYGPNESPGSNNFNFKNAEFDALYDRIKRMLPSPERTALYQEMRDIVLEEQPMIGSMARTRFYVWHPRLRNYQPEEVYDTWWKYLDVVDEPVADPQVAQR